ncbi:hypothetical protein AVEN_157330-1 [Araneus ventricosus]|uniref:Helitron helicase-like domain-containing protein n=1 Tax=Araneus ventricosus TaxID=182803 RepID=A0A4Y2RYF7_ARAVE|nr:hypothetical protein AVEN_157330-1 [Araneus ventricosus]
MLRLTESSLQTQQILQQKHIRQEHLRAFEDPIQTQQRLQQQHIRQNNLRASAQKNLQTQQRLQQQRIRQEILRTSELPDYPEQRLRVDQSQHVNRRQRSMRQCLCLEAFRYDPTKDYWLHLKAAIGKMNVICVIRDEGSMPTFKMQGQIYHRIGSLFPFQDRSPQFLQIYFFGEENVETKQRSESISGTRTEIVEDIERLLHQHNALVRLFKMAIERMSTDQCKLIIREDKTPVGEHERRCNAPTVNEVEWLRRNRIGGI